MRSPRKPYSYKIPGVERRLDSFFKFIADFQAHLLSEAELIASIYWDAVNDKKKNSIDKTGATYGIRISQKDKMNDRMVRIEWWRSKYRKVEAADKGKGPLRIYLPRGPGPMYDIKTFKKAKDWELDLIVKAETQFGYIRAMSKAVAEAKKQGHYARTSYMNNLARLEEEMGMKMLRFNVVEVTI